MTSNVGYLRADGKWISQYDSLFIVLNSKGQVVAWQFTKSNSIDECHDLLTDLKERFQSKDSIEVFVDNCCSIRKKLEVVLGRNITVKLDIFHATQRITRVIHKRHPLCRQVMNDIKFFI